MHALLSISLHAAMIDGRAKAISDMLSTLPPTTTATLNDHTLGVGCWLLPLSDTWPTFASLVAAAQEQQFSYRVCFLSQPLEWFGPHP